MRYTPLNYEKINIVAGSNFPSAIKSRNNQSFAFWERALFQRAISIFEFTFPESWQGNTKDFILYCLFKYGYGCVAYDEQFGVFFQPCTLSGYNFYYQPSDAIVTNPAMIESKTYEIGKDCEILKLTPDYMGIWDIIDYYAEKLSLLDNSINVGLVNSKFPFIFGAKNKAAAQAIKKVMDYVNKGEPCIVYDQRIADDANSKSEPWQFLDLKVKDNYLLDQQLQDFQTIINSFDCEIGIPTVPYQKKERMVTSEAESKQIESIARCTVWKESLDNSMGEINKMFDLGLSVKLRFAESEVSEDELS